VFPTAARLAAHRRMAPDHARPPTKEPAKKVLDADAVVDLAVENLRNDGAILAATIAPHLGVAIHGVESERKGEWIVKSRAVMAGNLIRERARKNPQLVRLLGAFNKLHETPEGLILAASLPAAIALDTGRMNPDSVIELQLFGKPLHVQPMRLVLGDVIDYVKQETEAGPPSGEKFPQSPANPNGAPAPSQVSGGVEAT
jgi:hypothetical protein